MLKAYKYRIYPNKQQEEQINKTFGCCRFVYNQMLAYRKELYETKKESMNKTSCNNYCNQVLKKEYEWLKEVDKFALTNAIYNMDFAYQKFFREHTGYPKFKSKRNKKKSYSTNFTNGNIEVSFENNKIKLPKLKWIKAKVHREFIGKIKSATISQDNDGKFYASVLFKFDRSTAKVPVSDNAIGLDYTSDGLYTDSNGNIRYITARRKMTIGKQYIFRLKQFAEEKFMATSLSATNIRGENTKSKASRDYKEMHSNTPIRKGNMEIEDEIHLGTEHVVTNLMIHSVSPEGRQLTEQFYTGDPFNVDIKLDNNSSNRQAEILNTYLKTMGLRLKFLKVPKKQLPAVKFPAIYFREDYKKDAVYFVENEEELEKRKNKKKNAVRFEAIRFYE